MLSVEPLCSLVTEHSQEQNNICGGMLHWTGCEVASAGPDVPQLMERTDSRWQLLAAGTLPASSAMLL